MPAEMLMVRLCPCVEAKFRPKYEVALHVGTSFWGTGQPSRRIIRTMSLSRHWCMPSPTVLRLRIGAVTCSRSGGS